MKNIYLIGDSIRYGRKSSKGYEYFLKQKLKDKANIYSPDENCRFAQYTLRGLCDWKHNIDCEKIDVVHWNNGLWDVLRLDDDEPLTFDLPTDGDKQQYAPAKNIVGAFLTTTIYFLGV